MPANNTSPAAGRIPLSATVISISLIAMVACVVGFLFVGDISLDAKAIYHALLHYDTDSTAHVIIRDWRLPRAVADLLVGAALAIAGAVMQSMTRNPLASPGIMGLNTGASFATVLALVAIPTLGRPGLMMVAIAGAALGAALVYGLGSLSRGGLTPVRLALTGVAVSTLLGSIGSGVMIYFELGQDVMLWSARGTQNVQWADVTMFLPFFIVGLVGSLSIAPTLSVLSLGDQVAQSLGQRTWVAKLSGSILVLLLAGGSVAVAGPVGFIGLMVPHMVRMLVGYDMRVVIPASALMGGTFLVVADICARLATTPYRAAVPVGVVTSLLGVPFFLYLACRRQPASRGGSL